MDDCALGINFQTSRRRYCDRKQKTLFPGPGVEELVACEMPVDFLLWICYTDSQRVPETFPTKSFIFTRC